MDSPEITVDEASQLKAGFTPIKDEPVSSTCEEDYGKSEVSIRLMPPPDLVSHILADPHHDLSHLKESIPHSKSQSALDPDSFSSPKPTIKLPPLEIDTSVGLDTPTELPSSSGKVLHMSPLPSTGQPTYHHHGHHKSRSSAAGSSGHGSSGHGSGGSSSSSSSGPKHRPANLTLRYDHRGEHRGGEHRGGEHRAGHSPHSGHSYNSSSLDSSSHRYVCTHTYGGEWSK